MPNDASAFTVGVAGVGDEGLAALAHQCRGVLVGRRLVAVGVEADAVRIFAIDGFTADAEQQCDNRRAVESGGVVGHGEQERESGDRAGIHVSLVVDCAVKAAERLVPDFRVG